MYISKEKLRQIIKEEIQAEGLFAKVLPVGVAAWLSQYFPQPDDAAEEIARAAVKRRGGRVEIGRQGRLAACLCPGDVRYYCRGKCPAYKCDSTSKDWQDALALGKTHQGARTSGACWKATLTEKKKTKVSKAGQKRVSKKIAILRKKEKMDSKQAIAAAIAMEKGDRLDKHGEYKKKKKKKMKEIYNWQAKANAHKIKVKWINPRKFTGYAAREKLFEEAENVCA